MNTSIRDTDRLEEIRRKWYEDPVEVKKPYRKAWNKGLKGRNPCSANSRLVHRVILYGNQRARKYAIGSEPYKTKAQWRKKEQICPPLTKEEQQIKL